LAAFAYGRTAGFHPSSRLNLTSTIQSGHVRQNDYWKACPPAPTGRRGVEVRTISADRRAL